jgi:F-type H+-transporting ATPase subunit a
MSSAEAAAMGFWAIHVDSMLWSIGLGHPVHPELPCRRKARDRWRSRWLAELRRVDHGLRGRKRPRFLQAQERHGRAAGTDDFRLGFLLNLMDLVPVDLIPHLFYLAGVPYMKIVPTTDVNVTVGLALGVFILIIYYSLKIKGPVGFIKELTGIPFQTSITVIKPIFWVINFVLETINLIAKPVSLALRLFGNLYARR